MTVDNNDAGAVPAKRPSGAVWVSEFPDHASTGDLSATFRTGVEKFIGAMQAAGANVSISSTLRPKERAHLMHYSWRIAKAGDDAATVPAMNGVDIEWVHATAAASRAAALAMVNGYGVVSEPSLTTRHTQGRAIDMTIGWAGNLTIKNKDGSSVTITTAPRTGENAKLVAVGATYGVVKATFAGDPPHWSDDGH